jgi:regulatory protein
MSEDVEHKEREYPPRKEKTPEQALAALMRYASKAERSSGDALRLMRGWHISEADSAKILARLREQKFIDDRRYAEAYVRDKMRFGSWGERKIRSGLYIKGISSEIISEAISAAKSDTNLAGGANGDRLTEILRRKAPSIKGTSPYDRRSKLIRYGLSKGFGYEEVIDAAERVIEV